MNTVEAEGAPDALQFRVIRLLDESPSLSQRDLAQSLGVSLGKAHYCLKALIDKGFVKARNYRNSQNKTAYLYLLTPRGMAEKGILARHFLEQRIREYDEIAAEITRLKQEASVSLDTEL